ncbi:MAG: pseudouridine synthase [Acidimicrobiales bacterium]
MRGEAHRPGIVHRLDRGTSGLLVVARTEDAYHSLVAQLAGHEVQRRQVRPPLIIAPTPPTG